MTLKTGGNSVKTFHCFKGVICRKWPVFKGSSKHIGARVTGIHNLNKIYLTAAVLYKLFLQYR